MPTEVFVGDRPELGVGTGSNALAGPAVGRLGGAHKLTRRFDICKASADKSSRAATLAATDCSACANQSPASCLTRGCVTGITRCCMHGDVARWLYWSRPGDRSLTGHRSACVRHSWAPQWSGGRFPSAGANCERTRIPQRVQRTAVSTCVCRDDGTGLSCCRATPGPSCRPSPAPLACRTHRP